MTQAVLGAVVADVTIGSRIGRAAVLWGLAYGTLPDLDMLALPWLDGVERLQWHRGISHSIVGIAAMTPLLAFPIAKWHGVALARAMLATFLVLATHVVIDVFTAYGTQLLEPFASTRFSVRTMFVIDPLYTLPLLFGVGSAVFAGPRVRRRCMIAGLVLSTLYAAATGVAKAVVNARFATAIATAGLPSRDWITLPTPLNAWYWRCLVLDTEADVVWSAYLALRDDPASITFTRIERGTATFQELPDDRAATAAVWFTEGYYAVRRDAELGTVTVGDLRLGDASLGRVPIDQRAPSVFRFDVSDCGRTMMMRPGDFGDVGAALRFLWTKLVGD